MTLLAYDDTTTRPGPRSRAARPLLLRACTFDLPAFFDLEDVNAPLACVCDLNATQCAMVRSDLEAAMRDWDRETKALLAALDAREDELGTAAQPRLAAVAL